MKKVESSWGNEALTLFKVSLCLHTCSKQGILMCGTSHSMQEKDVLGISLSLLDYVIFTPSFLLIKVYYNHNSQNSYSTFYICEIICHITFPRMEFQSTKTIVLLFLSVCEPQNSHNSRLEAGETNLS